MARPRSAPGNSATWSSCRCCVWTRSPAGRPPRSPAAPRRARFEQTGSTTTRSISPAATTVPEPSTACTTNVSRRPVRCWTSATTSTLPPTGVARRCTMRTAVPTVVCPALTNGAATRTVAASSHAINRGVASIGTSPLPTAAAVSSLVTSWRTGVPPRDRPAFPQAAVSTFLPRAQGTRSATTSTCRSPSGPRQVPVPAASPDQGLAERAPNRHHVVLVVGQRLLGDRHDQGILPRLRRGNRSVTAVRTVRPDGVLGPSSSASSRLIPTIRRSNRARSSSSYS